MKVAFYIDIPGLQHAELVETHEMGAVPCKGQGVILANGQEGEVKSVHFNLMKKCAEVVLTQQ